MQRSAETKLGELRDEITDLKGRLVKLQSMYANLEREHKHLQVDLDYWKARAVAAEKRTYEDVLPVKGQE